MEPNTSEDCPLIGPGCNNREIRHRHSLETTPLWWLVFSPTKWDIKNNMSTVVWDWFMDYTPDSKLVAKWIQDTLVALWIR